MNSRPDSQMNLEDPLAGEVIKEQAAENRREVRKLSDIAFAFLNAADGDCDAAERLFDDCVDLLCDGGVLQLWRYRILVDRIREGL